MQSGVGGRAILVTPPPPEEVAPLHPPDRQQRPDVRPPAGRHPPSAGQATAPQQVQDHALDEVVRGVPERDQIPAALSPGATQELVTQLAGGGLQGAARRRPYPTLADQLDTPGPAEPGHVLRI